MHLVKIVGKASVPSLKQTTPISSVLVCTVENSRKKKPELKGTTCTYADLFIF